MMPYVIRPVEPDYEPRWTESESFRPSLEVDGPKEVDTGLVDRFGNAIVRVQAPIGFGRDAEH